MTRTTELPMKTYDSETAAEYICRTRNQNRFQWVIVDGPCDGEYTVMDIRDAIDNDFAYRWVS